MYDGCGVWGGKEEKQERTRRSLRFRFFLRADMILYDCIGEYVCWVLVKFCLYLWCNDCRVCENVVMSGMSVVVVEEDKLGDEIASCWRRGDESDLSRSASAPEPERGLW